MKQAVIGIGTNIGDRKKNIADAVSALSLLPNTKVIKKSSDCETKPWGYENQQNFYNCCVCVETSLSPHALLGALLGIEASLGRIRTFKNAPRIIDLDLLLYENEKFSDEELTLPHPRICERAFVLFPLKELLGEEKFFSFDFSSAMKEADKSEIINFNV